MIAVLYDLLYVISTTFLAVNVGLPYFGGPEKPFRAYFMALVVVGILMTLKHWENRLKFLLPGIFLLLTGGKFLLQRAEDRIDYFWENEWVLWVTLTAAGCFLAGWLMARFRWVRRVMALLLVVGLVLFLTVLPWPGKLAVGMAILLLVMILADEIQLRWEKSGYVDAKGHLVSIAPFLLALSLLVLCFPAPENPYDWNFAYKIWQQASNLVKATSRWFHGSDEDYAGTIGFSDENHFWGNLRKRDKTVMTINSNKDSGPVIYLTGKIADTFDGRNWTARNQEETRDRMVDTLETLCAVNQYDPEYVRNYVWRVEVKVTFDEFNTKYFFSPLKSILGENGTGKVYFAQEGGDLVAPEKLGYGTEYTLAFYRMNQSHVGFQTFLLEAEGPEPDSWTSVRNQYEPDYFSVDGAPNMEEKYRGTSYEDYLSYRERIKTYYLGETPVSEELQEYLDKLYDGAETDLEKLSRIENLLSSFQYTERPGELPVSVETPSDFLEYFLLHKQEGYCSYFATTFVLLARNLGIPARFAQGFYVPKEDYQTVEVKSSMAHAWPEVYLDGIGWIPYEPTPGKKYVSAWAFKVKVDGSGPGAVMDHNEGKDEVDPELLQTQEEEKESLRIKWRVILIPLGLVLFFLIAFLLIDRAMIISWYRKLSDEGKFKVTFQKNLRILGLLGFAMEQGETLEEFYDRMSKEISERSLSFLKDRELSAYAGMVPTEKMRRNAEHCQDDLMKLLKEAKGKWYFWYQYQIFRMAAGKKP